MFKYTQFGVIAIDTSRNDLSIIYICLHVTKISFIRVLLCSRRNYLVSSVMYLHIIVKNNETKQNK